MQGFSHVPSVGILSTYVPTVCGLATFSAALADGLTAKGVDVSIVRIADGTASAAGGVVGELVNGSASSVAAASEWLNLSDVAVIQHEYGIYGGTDGDEVVEIMGALRVPSIVVLHTVLKDPASHQRSVLEAVVARAGRAVVMSASARTLLCAGYGIDPSKVTVIPHGAALPADIVPAPPGRPTILTWGLLGPGKGVERVIDAMAALADLPGPPRYLIAGRTHPKVLATEGEAYRNGLIAHAQRLGVADSVSFDPAYRTPQELTALLRGAAVVVLPYDSRDQVTSGVLIDSVANGRPVIATAFPHAVEVLGSGAGTVVGHDDPRALVEALRQLLTDPRTADAMASAASHLAPATAWPVVADAYVELARHLVAERLAAP
ncbi:glycosyltransferase [Mycolicibacterium parafortuitum]|uniref:Group 1 glycosyl transferase [Catenulispora acidiphila DSM] n=1 Tax=Mycolicibacterium parafortuitum TaxID=39692 RepID=A0A375YG43_MYCPF|nr:glycosyltransferase [Mycolicibacterium parafortuitum]ORB28812.1 glycosyl transferase family 1 [Mycolicibacterium parafortuitum]SRX80086.1 group 1 glycosyl transferase [Catenulispora acidiphila DSM] [Mycolicibacterium parafortuitum]